MKEPDKTVPAGFHTDSLRVVRTCSDLHERITGLFGHLRELLDNFQDMKSDLIFDQVDFMDLRVAAYQPFRGDSHIPTPESLKRKRAVINVQSSGNQCFMWSVLAALHPQKVHAERVEKYWNFRNELNFTDIEFPVDLENIETFERLNNIGITVFGWENGKPCRAPW